MTPDPARHPEREAEAVFDEFVARVEAGGGPVPDFDALCREHPDLESRLRAHHSEWLAVRSLANALREEYGAEEPADDGLRAALDVTLQKLRRRDPDAFRYRRRDELGRGGMGVVWRVWDDDLGRHVAMKVLRGDEDATADPDTLARFLTEAQITSQLDHPGIVSVHDMGVDPAGKLYFTMNLVRGDSLSTLLSPRRGTKLVTGRLLSVLLRVCDTLEYAHSQGVIHRDLKPSNVMVGRFGEVYVMDWGLAKLVRREPRDRGRARPDGRRLDADSRDEDASATGMHTPLTPLTAYGSVMGTPAFMAPELATGASGEWDRRGDVYAVGAMLYQFLTGLTPYGDLASDRDPRSVLECLERGPPTPPQRLAPDAPGELIAICNKAMARAPADRYDHMGEMAADLRAFQEGRVVAAHQSGAFAELAKWVGRNRVSAALACGVVLVAFASLLLFWWQERHGQQLLLAKNAELDEQRAEAQRKADSLGHVAERFDEVFRMTSPEEARGRPVVPVEMLERAAADLEADLAGDPPAYLHLATTLGDLFYNHEHFQRAVTLWQRALEVLPQVPELDLDQVCGLHIALEDALLVLGRPDEAAAVLDRLERTLVERGGGPAYRALLLGERADVEFQRNRLSECEALLNEALPLAQGDRRMLVVNGLALVYSRQGRHEEAVKLLEPETTRYAAEHGDDHPEAIRLLHNLSDAQMQAGRTAAGLATARRSLALCQQVFGAESRDTVNAQHSLALALWETGQLKEARDLAAASYAASAALNPEDPVALNARRGLATLETALGHHAAARTLFEEELALRRALNTDADADTILTLTNLGRACHGAGELDDARRYLEEAVQIAEELDETDLTRIVPARINLAAVYRSLEENDLELALLEAAQEQCEQLLDESDPLAIQAQAELASAYFAAEEYDSAGELLDDAVSRAREFLHEGHHLRKRVLFLAAKCHLRRGSKDEARELLDELLEHTPQEDPDWATYRLMRQGLR